MVRPSFSRRRALQRDGYRHIAGIDEVGTGALAGPVYAAAVILPTDSRIGMIRDSKRLTAKQRAQLAPLIKERADGWAVGTASVTEIMTHGVRNASYIAMRRALEHISCVDFALVDAWNIPDISIPQEAIIRGDKYVKSIAAASILAKVARDQKMTDMDQLFPEYGFAKHKGYGTVRHRSAIKKYGACEIHRLNYKIFKEPAV